MKLALLTVLLLAPGFSLRAEEEAPAWSVDAPPGESETLTIEVDEGTWMNVDVSPDGREVLFDLLGDLYIVGEDGEARSLTSGIAWDMQGRFSPDGKRIAFTSDRGGGDNIWVVDRDGSNARQVTKESYRLLNSPVWTPDGEYIAARKHFTSRRSLGAGEIWLYHHSGGGGLQLVEKPTDQKDLGEPAFSPDGRYLYYSLDSTPGSTFEYNKDSNTGIYSIRRLDRHTGRTITLVGGAGGAIRPTPSPDGTRLAFVRRVRFQSVLFVKDLRSGEERPVYEHLERDFQETWAIHGVYPTMAWTPDSKNIVVWAAGKIRRVDASTREVRTLPFRVETEREIRRALRVPITVAPERFLVRLLRWVQVSPTGDRVLFQALGSLWIRDLPEGKPRRLTDVDDRFEFWPSFSRDGRRVIFTTWNDESFGSVRVRDIDSGVELVLTRDPGHYVEPVLSPDGETAVYRKVSGGYLRSPLWSSDTGLYRVRLDGSDPELLTRSGSRPQFAAASDRVYFTQFGGKRSLASLSLDPQTPEDREPRTHYQSENATEFAVSPDGRWLAFRERFHAFVTPFLHTGGAVDVGPKASAVPLRKVTAEAGENLHFSGDSKALHWSLGPDLYTRELAQTFEFVEGATDLISEPDLEGRRISFEAKTYRPEGILALVGARIVTMAGDEVIEEGSILIERDRIVRVGKREAIEIPQDAHVVDASGLTILPGLVDVHAHGSQGSNGITPQQNWISYSQLSFGVTTIHDPSNHTNTIFSASELQRAGITVAPRIYSTGTILYGATGDFKAEIDSLEDARFHLHRMQAVGAFSVKSYNQPRRDQRQQVVAAARELGMMVVPEGGSLLQHNLTMVVDGHTGVEHCVPVARVYDDIIKLWSGTRVGYTPTLGVAYGGISGENYWYDKTDVWKNERLLSFVPRSLIDARSRRRTKAPDGEYNHISAAKICKQFTDAGIEVNLGAHGQREGLAAHWEIWMFCQGGMTPHEALRAATLNGARYVGLDKDIGSIEVGKLADLIVLEKNPLEDIRRTESIRWTVLGGRLFDARSLDELGPPVQKRRPFWFEGLDVQVRELPETGCGCAYSTHRH